VTDWITAQDGEWAACINLMTTHMHYEPQQEFDLWGSAETWEIQNRLEDQRWSFYSGNRPWSQKEQLVDLYDGTIREVDARIGFLYRWLESQGLLEDTLLIVTGDHGECFGEYSTPRPGIRLSDHTIGIHDRQLHVPLFVRPPGTRKEVVTEPVSLTGLYDMLASVVEDDMSVESLHERTPVAAVDMHRRIKYGGDNSMELIDRYGIDIDQFEGFARAIYTEETKRYAHWGNDTEPVEIPTAVWEAMTGYEDQQVAVKADVNSETKERLKKLGYL
jgi:arylsulfatase A-like enzyme